MISSSSFPSKITVAIIKKEGGGGVDHGSGCKFIYNSETSGSYGEPGTLCFKGNKLVGAYSLLKVSARRHEHCF